LLQQICTTVQIAENSPKTAAGTSTIDGIEDDSQYPSHPTCSGSKLFVFGNNLLGFGGVHFQVYRLTKTPTFWLSALVKVKLGILELKHVIILVVTITGWSVALHYSNTI